MGGGAPGTAAPTAGEDRESGGRDIRGLLLAAAPGPDDGDVVRLSGLRIDGLDLRNETLAADVVFDDCHFTGRTRLERLRAGSVTFRGCRFDEGLGMTAAQFVGDLDIIGGWVGQSRRTDEAALELRDASVTAAAAIRPGDCAGMVRLDRAVFAEALTVGGKFTDIRGPDMRTGRLHLKGVWCQGDILLQGATATHGCSGAGVCVVGDLSLDALRTNDVSLEACAVDGSICLDAATVSGTARFNDVAAGLRSAPLGALLLNAATIREALIFTRCVLRAPLRMTSTTVGGPVRLSRSVLTGSVSHPAVEADDACVTGAATIEGCRATRGVSLARAEIGGELALALEVTGRRILDRPGLDLTAAKIHGSLVLARGFPLRVEGGVAMPRVEVDQDVVIGEQAQFSGLNTVGIERAAVDLDRARIGGAILVETPDRGDLPIPGLSLLRAAAGRLSVRRAVATPGLIVDGLTTSGTVVVAAQCASIRAVDASCEAMTIEGSVGGDPATEALILDGVRVMKHLCLVVDVAGTMRVVGGHADTAMLVGSVECGAPVSADLSGLEVRSLVFHHRRPDLQEQLHDSGRRGGDAVTFATRSEVTLSGAQVPGELDLTGLRGLPAPHASARGPVPKFIRGRVDLRDARVGTLRVPAYHAERTDTDLPVAANACLAGARYDTIFPGPSQARNGRAVDDEKVQQDHGRSVGALTGVSVEDRLLWLQNDPDQFEPTKYSALAAAYQKGGYTRAAVDVRIAYERRRRRLGAGRMQLAWSWLLDRTVGYGYRPEQSIPWLVGFWLAGSALIWLLRHDFKAPSGTTAQPGFNPLIYFLDQLLPFLSTSQEDYQPLNAASWVVPALVIIGWILFTAVAAGLTAATRRDH